MNHKTAFKIALVALFATGLVACREEEQGRPLSLEPGVYLGPKDEKLTKQDLEALRQRSRLQQDGL